MASPQLPNFKFGCMEQSDTLGIEYHNAARTGNKKKLKKIIAKGIQVDYSNDQGQSPLFLACFDNMPASCDVLLTNGANPNERSNDGITPVHMAAYSGNVKLLSDVLADGGDLRLHDSFGRTTKDWALCQPEPKKRLKMLEFLDKAKLFALTTSGRDLRVGNKVSTHNTHVNKHNSLVNIIRNKFKGGYDANIEHLKSSHSMGFGKVYLDGDSSSGFMTNISLISESCLHHNGDGLTFENGAFMVMESMLWQTTHVTAKRLHREAQAGGQVDLLITETDFVGKLRHPNILLLMGICQTNNLDGLVLLYENISLGSLYYCLHEKSERLPTSQIHEILVQICSAIIFLHEQDLLHCYITSHAVYLVSQHTAKLGNLEYAIETDKSEVGKKCLVVNNKYENAAYNWMSPEIMNKCCPSEASDMYSFCVVMWEMFDNTVPWGRCDAASIRHKLFNDGEQLPLGSTKTPHLYLTLMEYGLQFDPLHRQLTFNHVRDLLGLSAEKVKQYIANFLPKQQPAYNNAERISDQDTSSRIRTSRLPKREGARHPREQQMSRKPQRPKSRPDEQKIHRTREQGRHRHDQNQSSKDKEHHHVRKSHETSSSSTQEAPVPQYRHKSKDGVSFDVNKTHWDLQEEQDLHQYSYRVKVLPKHPPRDQHYQHHDNHQQGCDHHSYDNGKQTQVYDEDSAKEDYHDQQHPKQQYRYEDEEDQSQNGSSSQDKNNVISSESDESCSTRTSSTHDSDQVNTSLGKSLSTRFSYLQLQHVRSPAGVSIKPAGHCTAPPDVEKDREIPLSNAGSVYALYNMDGPDNTPHRPNTPNTMPRKRKRMDMTPEVNKRMGMTPEVNNDAQRLQTQTGSVRNLVDLYQHQESSHMLKQAVLHGNIKECLYPSLNSPENSARSCDSDNYNNHGMDKHNRQASNARIRSPLFDDDPKGSKISPSKGKKYGSKQSEVEECYFDDVAHQDLEEQSNIQLQPPVCPELPVTYGLEARKSSFIISPQIYTECGETNDRDRRECKQSLCIESYQQSQYGEKDTIFQDQSEELKKTVAYVSIVTISSDLDDPEQHHITHTLTDLENGVKNTMYKKSIRASRIVSSVFSQ